MKRLVFIILAVALMFAVNVQAQTANFTLEWDAPTTNEDGTPLTDLAGFRVYHTVTSGSYNVTDMWDVGNVLITTQTLPVGNHCFVATAYDTSNNESVYSNEVCKDALRPAPFELRITIN